MIAYLKGELTLIEPALANIECAGVGYELRISLTTYSKIKDKTQIKLHTHLQIKEDAHVLYGFYDINEKHYFEKLIGVNGIGGNTAILILSSISLADLHATIHHADIEPLKKIKGIGEKTASRVILELKNKLPDAITGADGTTIPANQILSDAGLALQALGFTKNESSKKASKAYKTIGMDATLEAIIKMALQS